MSDSSDIEIEYLTNLGLLRGLLSGDRDAEQVLSLVDQCGERKEFILKLLQTTLQAHNEIRSQAQTGKKLTVAESKTTIRRIEALAILLGATAAAITLSLNSPKGSEPRQCFLKKDSRGRERWYTQDSEGQVKPISKQLALEGLNSGTLVRLKSPVKKRKS